MTESEARERESGNAAYSIYSIGSVTTFGRRAFVARPDGVFRVLRALAAARFRRAGSRGFPGWLLFDPERFPDPAALLRERLGCEVTILPDTED